MKKGARITKKIVLDQAALFFADRSEIGLKRKYRFMGTLSGRKELLFREELLRLERARNGPRSQPDKPEPYMFLKTK